MVHAMHSNFLIKSPCRLHSCASTSHDTTPHTVRTAGAASAAGRHRARVVGSERWGQSDVHDGASVMHFATAESQVDTLLALAAQPPVTATPHLSARLNPRTA
jgi:hypothetical protein